LSRPPVTRKGDSADTAGRKNTAEALEAGGSWRRVLLVDSRGGSIRFWGCDHGAVRACDRADAATPSTSSEQVFGGNDGAAQDRKRLLAKW